ncbi:hypothetical protein RGQ29_007785 [Quercus rubra]|uniref:Uncharacterized protein n=1 Tax=Quercus rubra TaxID=3512 RepID=A0AAN7HVN2_QUERU|nr:hypothetical protein RGQ29_007785 [Quercus rubra]
MGIHYLRLLFVVFVIALAISQQSNCRQIYNSNSEEAKSRDKNNFYSRYSWHFSAKALVGSTKDDIDPVYGVSLRTVPQGPNPLHN